MKLILILSLSFFSVSLWAIEGTLKLGVRPYYFTQLETEGADLWGYYKNEYDLASIGMTNFHINVEGRLLYAKVNGLEEQFFFMPTEFNFVWQSESSSLQVGAQQFAFSETFGVNLMDIMNPRDYRFSIMDKSEFYKLAQWSINYKYFNDEFFLQTVWTPVPRSNRYPVLGSPFAFYSSLITKVNSPKNYDFGDGEFALRAGQLFDNGLDLTLLLATHQSRSLTYGVDIISLSEIEATPRTQRVYSLGLSATYALEAFVWRGDLLYTRDDYLLGLNDSGHVVPNHLQSVVGGDWTSDSGLQLGGQLHFDSHNSSEQSQWWGSFLISHSFMQEKLFLEQILFKGVTNSDWWSKTTVKWSDDSYTLELTYQFLQGEYIDGGIGVFDKGDFLQLSFEWAF